MRKWFLLPVLAGILALTAVAAAGGASSDPPGLERAIAAQEKHTNELLATEGVVGTAVGLGANGTAVVLVLTEEPGVKGIPGKLDGVVVVTRVAGKIVAFADPTSRFDRPVPIGVSTGHPNITAGTIGVRVKDANGNVYALSNNHVYADENNASINDNVLQPGPFDGGVNPADAIGTLQAFEPLKFDGSDNSIDAAIALSSTSLLGSATPDDGYGQPSSTTVDPSLRLKVKKYGRTTELTNGRITAINATVNVGYDSGTAKFVNQIIIEPGNFSAGGDSGSLIVTKGGNNPVGLLFAGSFFVTIANPIDPVLARFGVTVDDGSAPPEQVTDIAITGVSAPASVVKGALVSVDVTVENVGNQAVTSDINVTLTDDTDIVTIGTLKVTGGLAVGASATLNYSWDTGNASLGEHTLTGSHDLTDDDAANNSKSAAVTVNEESQPGGTGTIQGRVTDASTGGRIQGVTVTTDTGESATTNRGGKYTISDVPEGNRTVTATLAGYISQDKPATVVAGDTEKVNFELTPTPG